MLSIKALTTLLPFITTTLALPTTSHLQTRDVPSRYVIQAIHSTAPIHLQFLATSNSKFFIGNETASYCPQQVPEQGGVCPPGNQTVFAGECALDVEVPGGQAIYVTPEGALGHTTAHSAYFPPGSVQCPLQLTPAQKSCNDNGSVQPDAEVSSNAFGATGLMACPTPEGPYQVFAALQNATVPMGDVSECIGFLGLAYDFGSGFGAWQYS